MTCTAGALPVVELRVLGVVLMSLRAVRLARMEVVTVYHGVEYILGVVAPLQIVRCVVSLHSIQVADVVPPLRGWPIEGFADEPMNADVSLRSSGKQADHLVTVLVDARFQDAVIDDGENLTAFGRHVPIETGYWLPSHVHRLRDRRDCDVGEGCNHRRLMQAVLIPCGHRLALTGHPFAAGAGEMLVALGPQRCRD